MCHALLAPIGSLPLSEVILRSGWERESEEEMGSEERGEKLRSTYKINGKLINNKKTSKQNNH